MAFLHQCQCVHVICVTTCLVACPSSLLAYPCAGDARLPVYCTGEAVAAGAWRESGGQTEWGGGGGGGGQRLTR